MSRIDTSGAGGPYEDPGWRSAVTPWFVIGFFAGMVPFFGRRMMARAIRRQRRDGLLLLRQLFLNFVVAVVLIGVVASSVAPNEKVSTAGQQLTAVVLVALGLGCISAADAFGRRPLDCSDDAHLRADFHSRFFLRVALSEVAALVAFAAVFVVGGWWLYWIGAVFTLVGLARAAPTVSNLSESQLRLNEAGCSRSLVELLRRAGADNGRS